VNTAVAFAPRASENRLRPIRRNDGVVLEWGGDYDVAMNNTSVAGVRIPRLAGEIHDGLAQYSGAVCMQVEMAKQELHLRKGDKISKGSPTFRGSERSCDSEQMLIASIAHEINQPLAAIVTNADAGLRWLSGNERNLHETDQAIRRIIRDGKRASAMVSRMRALFKKTLAETEPLYLNDVIQEVVAIVQSEAERNRISLRTDLADDLPRLMGDKIQLQQVISNLLVNAIQALSGTSGRTRELYISSQKGSQVHVNRNGDQGEEVSVPEEILIEVRDSGPGFDPEQLNQLFEAFYTTKPEGLGIGLTISRTIVEAHGGRLWAKPNEPRGAAFLLSLPVRS
jgi:signal transduction histidine kinase